MPKQNSTGRLVITIPIPKSLPQQTHSGDMPPSTTQSPAFTRSHPYAHPTLPFQGSSRVGGTQTEAKVARQMMGRALLESGAMAAGQPTGPCSAAEIKSQELAFKAFLREVPDLDPVTQAVAYNMLYGTHVDHQRAMVWHSQVQGEGYTARLLARQPGATWSEIGAELPPLDRPFGQFTLDEQNHLLFTAFRRVTGTANDAAAKLRDLYGQDIGHATAEAWGHQDRVRQHRARDLLRNFLRHHPEVNDVDTARQQSGVPRNQTTDTEIRRLIGEAQRVRLLEQALAMYQPGIGTVQPAPAEQRSASWASTAASTHEAAPSQDMPSMPGHGTEWTQPKTQSFECIVVPPWALPKRQQTQHTALPGWAAPQPAPIDHAAASHGAMPKPQPVGHAGQPEPAMPKPAPIERPPLPDWAQDNAPPQPAGSVEEFLGYDWTDDFLR